MGFGLEVKCSNCGYNENFILGIGMMPLNSFEVIKNEIMDVGEKVKIDLLKAEHFLVSDADYKIMNCENCDGLYKRLSFNLIKKDQIIKFQHKCPTCHSYLKVASNIKNCNCPHCHQLALTSQLNMMWD